MRLIFAGTTDVGRRRERNEDAFLLLPEERLCAVADGMGGHASGEVAARLAVEQLGEFFRHTGRDQESTWPYQMDPARSFDENRLLVGVRMANQRIVDLARADEKLRGMGTTLVAAHFAADGGAALVAHVGDSRAYLCREGTLRQLTEDHSLVNDWVKQHRLTPEEAERFPHRNVIVRALGMREDLEVDLIDQPFQQGDVLLLCSDGLSGAVRDPRVAEIISGHRGDLAAAAQLLVVEANEAGGIDNVTCVLAATEGP
jgi:PPM family protein phosphatase